MPAIEDAATLWATVAHASKAEMEIAGAALLVINEVPDLLPCLMNGTILARELAGKPSNLPQADSKLSNDFDRSIIEFQMKFWPGANPIKLSI
jgi:hypothetical protein